MDKLKDLELRHLNFLIKRVMDENKAQIKKWGIQAITPAEWMLFLTEEVGELAQAIAETEYRDKDNMFVVMEAIQVATLSLKIAEMYLEAEYGE